MHRLLRPWRTVRALAAVCGLVIVLTACSSSDDAPSTGATTSRAPGTTGAADAHPDALELRPVGDARPLPDAFFGFNAASIVQSVNVDLLLSPELQEQLATFPARFLRVPTGTAAQWIDWRTGRFMDEPMERPGVEFEDPESLFASIPADRRSVTMQDWAALIEATDATPVWDLNVLNATLEDQLAMLAEAERLGLPVTYIELGNELWDVRSIYPDVYPTGTDYAREMNTWIPALRERYPDAQIAVSGADPSDAFFVQVFGERFVTWNDEVTATIEGADAIAIHPYWTLPELADPGSDVAATLTAGLDAFADFEAETLAAIPDEFDIWLTEWNQAAWGSGEGTQIWAQALSVLAVGMHHAAEGRITVSLLHNIVDGAPNPHDAGISVTFPLLTNGTGGSEPLDRTALGHTVPELFSAVGPGSSVLALEAVDGPAVGAHPAVTGVQVTGTDPGAVFVNLADTPVRVRLPEAMTGEWATTTLAAPAEAEPGWVPGEEPEVAEGTTAGTVLLPAYSVVRLARG